MSKQLIFNQNDKGQVHFYFSKKKMNEFKQKYPNLTSLYLTKCLELALESKKFFDNVLCKNFDDLSYGVFENVL